MFDYHYEQEVAEEARKLWKEGRRTLSWSASPSSNEQPWVEGWADVYVPELCRPLGANWLATIVAPGDEEEAGWGYFHVAHDSELILQFDNQGRLATKTLLRSDGPNLEVSIDEELSSIGLSFYQRQEWRQEGFFPPRYHMPVWSVEKIASVVEDWLEAICGHRFSLKLGEEESPLVESALQSLQEIESGEQETFDLGDGLRVSEKALDDLLQNPESSAELVAKIKDLFGDKIPPGQEEGD